MKRKLFFAAMFTGIGAISFAQTTQMTNKNGLVITPEAGDWVLGMNASPFLNYVGNLFNGTTNNSVGTAFVDGNNAIYGKYFATNDMAYRGSLRITALSNSSSFLFDTNTVDQQPDYLEDVSRQSGFGFYLSGGLEWRKGHNRLQGYYGGELMLMFGALTPNVTNEYALAMDSTNIANNLVTPGRTLESRAGSTFGFGVRPFVGVEYFVLPKLSIAGEFGWGLMFSTTSEGENTTEQFDFTTNEAFTTTARTGGSNNFLLTTDNLGGAIRIFYHF